MLIFPSAFALVGLSTRGQGLGAAVQLHGYFAGIYLSVITGGIYITNEILSGLLSSRQVCHEPPFDDSVTASAGSCVEGPVVSLSLGRSWALAALWRGVGMLSTHILLIPPTSDP